MKFFLRSVVILALTSSCCHEKSHLIEPHVFYVAPDRLVQSLPSAFTPLTTQEAITDWGKELRIADRFANEMDLYRAITGYKRTLVLLPLARTDLRLRIDYDITLCYFLGGQYASAINAFENSALYEVPADFPALEDLMIIIYESYRQIKNDEKAEKMMEFLEKKNPETAQRLRIATAAATADFNTLQEQETEMTEALCLYHKNALSVKKAQNYNMILPGAGYWYVGQKQAAKTAFIINALFTAAAVQLACDGQWAAAAIVTSLEAGWYFGGINGAGLAAKEYNEKLYGETVRQKLTEKKLFPALQLHYAF